MEITVLDTNFSKIEIVDALDSFIWTDRYYRRGDFEIANKPSIKLIESLKEDYYLTIPDSIHTMIIESIELKTNIETGDKMLVSGRSLESILDRRILTKQTTLSGGFQSAIRSLLLDNVIDPEDPDRKITNFIFKESSDPGVEALSVDEQFFGDNLYDVIEALCTYNEIGFQVILTEDNEFEFSLYNGKDRSFDQVDNPFVSFSPSLDNLSNTTYYYSKIPRKTATIVGGEGEGADQTILSVMLPGGGGTGLSRREMYTDASDLASSIDGEILSEEDYLTLLTNRGIRELTDNQAVSAFDGKLDPTTTYVYGVDFFIGDIVQMKNEYNLTGKTRVTEVVFSENIAGRSVYPTFDSTK